MFQKSIRKEQPQKLSQLLNILAAWQNCHASLIRERVNTTKLPPRPQYASLWREF
jgi:hypothetical protein